ncbi:permease [Antrihabitans cavernicola]|uniref:Permease n=1 Tax=Antrihabitans cavernicola TaxID=2495913 RepID=A0A5A7S7C2_9NOCA|nr:permease [Spelaeibacter cavernicola]KAA0018546.1 permease [Spelaeibacter cavernicola]
MSSTHIFVGVVLLAIVAQTPLARFVREFPRLQTAATVFASVFIQATPFLVLGVAVSGSIAAFVSPSVLRRVLPGNQVAAIGIGGLAGMALPGCECGAVPVARRLFDHGAGAAALSFLLSVPAINPVVLVATAVAFPGEPGMVAARFAGSLATALVMGALWSRFGRPSWVIAKGRGHGHHETAGSSRREVFSEAARHDLLQAGSFLVLGAAAAAALHVLVPATVYDHLAGHLVLSIVVLAVLAVVLALCSEADAFVAASMSALPLLPRLVFLVVGPAVDVKLFTMQAGTFGRAFAVRFAPTTFVVAVVCGTVAGLIFVGAR